MIVQELIDALSKLDPTKKVLLQCDTDGDDFMCNFDVKDVREDDDYDDGGSGQGEQVVIIEGEV